MSAYNIQIVITMTLYIFMILFVGFYLMRWANKSSENYFLGGRTLGPWVTAMSAEASDMSGWLMMGLPGVAYFFGLADAFWTAIGLAIGTYLNWLITSKRLRCYSVVANNSITLPDFFNNRFKDDKKIILIIASLWILVFFTVYASSCFVTGGKLFSTLFGLDYRTMMVISALFVILYTIIGGFLAESISDMIQGFIMICALFVVLIVGVVKAGGPAEIVSQLREFPGFLEFFAISSPGEVQNVVNGTPIFDKAGTYGFITIISTMSWGLGYFGMPQVLLRFMAIRKVNELKRSRRIAIIWVVLSLFAAVCIGLVGRVLFPTAHTTLADAENIYIITAQHFLPALMVGLVMAGILASAMSSSDSYLLIASSAFSMNVFKGLLKKDATDKQIMVMSRITLIILSFVGIVLVLDEKSVIFTIVSFAWAGFGATFGPLMLFSLFWKRTNRAGAIAGMISGAAMVFIWKLGIKAIGLKYGIAVLGIYELLPAFLISCISIVVFSLASKKPSAEIEEEFERAKAANIEDIEKISDR